MNGEMWVGWVPFQQGLERLGGLKHRHSSLRQQEAAGVNGMTSLARWASDAFSNLASAAD